MIMASIHTPFQSHVETHGSWKAVLIPNLSQDRLVYHKRCVADYGRRSYFDPSHGLSQITIADDLLPGGKVSNEFEGNDQLKLDWVSKDDCEMSKV